MRAAFFIFMLCCSLAQAEPAASSANNGFANPANAAAISPAAGMAQSLIALCIVIAVLFALVWLLRRFNLAGPGSAHGMSVQQGISVGPKERAVVIQVDGRRLLLGVAPGQVTLLKELDAVAPEATVAAPALSAQATAFKDILKRSLGLKGNDPS